MKTKEKIQHSNTRDKLVTAAVKLMLQKGFTATSVDEICEVAGATKGSFFHYFESKEDLAKAAINYFSSCQMQGFETASFNALADPLDRLYGFLDYMITAIKNPEVVKSCLIGNLTQELSQTHSEIRLACAENFSWHNKKLQSLMDEAIKTHPPKSLVDTESLAKYFYAVMQGSLILAKASQDSGGIVDNIEHFRKYLQVLFAESQKLKADG